VRKISPKSPRPFTSTYSNSRALVVGIDKYRKAAPLSYAVSDAKGVAAALQNHCGFPGEHIKVLVDDDATKDGVMRAFLSFERNCQDNDRIVFFFAGHGHTRQSYRGDVGYLVPVDGDIDDLVTLIRWNELTDNSELIGAKHMLFIMDACYSGLAIMRGPTPGSVRFLRDLMQRYGRQVITAGKSDQTVADSGGPKAGHSVFTGHLLEGIEGRAETREGLLTATGLMSYSYEHVAKDGRSRQTPDFGCIAGDGDMVLRGFPPTADAASESQEGDELVPAMTSAPAESQESLVDFTDRVKDLLAEPTHTIRLHDLMMREVRQFLALTTEDLFSLGGKSDPEELLARVARYESASERLLAAFVYISHWGKTEHRRIFDMVMSRSVERAASSSGLVAWLRLRWYPAVLLSYVGGIAAVAAGEYGNLAAILGTQMVDPDHLGAPRPMLAEMTRTLPDLQLVFKAISGLGRSFAPLSEYVFKHIQPLLDDLLFLGQRYEALFDRYEVLQALVCQDVTGYGPLGRFAWKHWNDLRQQTTMYPFLVVAKEAEAAKEEWPPLRAGLFGGSYERLSKVIRDYGQFLDKNCS
jgi:hypothetical protein